MSRWIYASLICLLGQSNCFAVGPFSPEDAQQQFELHPDCKIELVAAEPDVIDPVHIEFAPDGKLWVVEYSDYPNGPKESQPGLSRIRVLTDADGDGKYSNATVFADKLLFANGLMLWQDGVLVTSDGKLLFMRDTDNDGRADDTQIWFEGFITENPQLRHNHPMLGLDNKIYVANGLRGGNIVPGPDYPWEKPEDPKPVSISGMDFCFDPFTGDYEAITGYAQFGHTFDDVGNRFGCTNRNPCKHFVIPDQYLKRNPKLRVRQTFEDVSPAGEKSRLYPISRTWTTSNLHANQFTAACGVTIYRGDALGDDFYGNSFTCDPTANLIHRDVLTPHGGTFTSQYGRDGVEFLATKDEWFRAVNMAHGPDGALYVIDMYRAVVEHPQFMPDELKNRPDLLQGTDKGRIWRIVRKDFEAKPGELLAKQSPEELVTDLEATNVWQRETARRLLLEAASVPTDKLVAICQSSKSPLAAVAARQVLKHHGEVSDELDARILSMSDIAAIALLRANDSIPVVEANPEQFAKLVSEHDAASPWNGQLMREVALLMPFSKAPQSLRQKYVELLSAKDAEHWLMTAILTGVTPDVASELKAKLHQRGAVAALETVYEMYPDVKFLTDGTEQYVSAKLKLALAAFNAQPSLAATWIPAAIDSGEEQSKQAREFCQWVFKTAGTTISPDRRNAIELIGRLNSAGLQRLNADGQTALPDPVDVLVSLLDESDSQIQQLAVSGLGRQASEKGLNALMDRYVAATPAIRRAILSALSRSSLGIDLLLTGVEQDVITKFDVDAGLKRVLERNSTHGARAKELLAVQVAADRAQVIKDYLNCLEMESDPQRGRLIFEKNCAVCHKIGTVGVDVAPDISDSRTKTRDFLLTNILDPNRAIDNNYFSYSVIDTAGRVHTGIMSSETSTSITLRQPEGKTITLSRDEIEELKNNGVSLMPVGLEKTINPQQMADVISFIKNWRYLDGLVPEEVIR